VWQAAKDLTLISKAGISASRRLLQHRKLPCSGMEFGFSLLEIIVVMFIVSVVMMAAMPDFLALSDEPLKREAMRLASLIRYENDQAVTRKETHYIRFDLERSAWTVIVADGKPNRSGQLNHNVRFLDIITPSRGKIDRGTQTVTFTPDGLIDPTVIHIEREKLQFSVIIYPYAAHVETYEGYRQ